MHTGLMQPVCREVPFVAEAKRVWVETATIAEVLAQTNAPATIHYLNLDTEGSELEILRTFPFDKHKVCCITLEHNFEEPKRSEIHALLSEKTDFLLAYSIEWDDWYVHRSMQARLQVLYSTVHPPTPLSAGAVMVPTPGPTLVTHKVAVTTVRPAERSPGSPGHDSAGASQSESS